MHRRCPPRRQPAGEQRDQGDDRHGHGEHARRHPEHRQQHHQEAAGRDRFAADVVEGARVEKRLFRIDRAWSISVNLRVRSELMIQLPTAVLGGG